MKSAIQRSLVAITSVGALTLLGGLAAAPAGAATAPAHAGTARVQSPNSLGFCLTHWQDNNGTDLNYATFTCIVTGDTVWEGFAQCTNFTVYFTREHVGAGNDQLNCPPGFVVVNAGVNFLN
jgi:hypothetical protein